MNIMGNMNPAWKPYAAAAAIAVAGIAAGFGLSQWLGNGAGRSASSTEDGCEEGLYWYDPMAPNQHFDKPGKSPFMDMQLLPKCAGDDVQGAGGVSIDPALIQNFGIRTTKAEYGVLEPETTVTGTLDR